MIDFVIYWWHRMNHEHQALWRFHKVHHLDQFLDVSSAVRFHYGEVVIATIVRGCYIWITDINFESVIAAEALLLIASIFQHSNIRLPKIVDRTISLVFVTPDWHWMHHHVLREDTDSNYGNILTIWDRLFYTVCLHQRRKDMPIGLPGLKDKSFFSLLIVPFK